VQKIVKLQINCKKEILKNLLLNPLKLFNDIIYKREGNIIYIKLKNDKLEYSIYLDADYDRITYILESEKDKYIIKFDLISNIFQGSTSVLIFVEYFSKTFTFSRKKVNEIVNYIIQKLNNSNCNGPVAQPG